MLRLYKVGIYMHLELHVCQLLSNTGFGPYAKGHKAGGTRGGVCCSIGLQPALRLELHTHSSSSVARQLGNLTGRNQASSVTR
jgi:hypothetical protein